MKKLKISLMFMGLLYISNALTSCKKDKTDETDAAVAKSNTRLSFHIHNVMSTGLLTYGTNYTDNIGRKLNFSVAQYYISGITLIRPDNSQLKLSGKYLMVKPTVPDYDLGEVPEGIYNGILFSIGIDSITNHSDITTYATGNPLAIQLPSMHWSWNSGYIFMKLEGQVDTTLLNSGSPDYDFFMHIGTDNMLKNLDFSGNPFSVLKGQTKQLVITVDYNKLFNGIDLRNENQTHTNDNLSLANKIVANISSAFSLD